MTSAAPRTDDADLLRACRAGEIDAFGELVERYQNLVCAVAYSRTGDRVTSEDVGQQTFLAAWNGLDTIREPGQIRSWLCSVARNLSGKAIRVRKRETSTDTESLEANESPSSDPLANMISRESEAAVWEALAELPDTYREPLVLFYRENQSVKQVALGLGLSEDAVKQRLSRGRQALKAGVSDLVERTLETNRPNRAFAAGVLGAVRAAGAPGAAAGTGKAASGASTKVLWGGAALAAVLVAAVAVAASGDDQTTPSHELDAATVTATSPNHELLAHLRQQRDALRAENAGKADCAFEGTVTDTEGHAVPGAVVSLAEDSLRANTLDPQATQSDAEGHWRSGPLRGAQFLISVTAPGYLAATALRRCDAAGRLDVVLAEGGTRFRGTVEDVGGGPVEGVSVWMIPSTGNPNAAVATMTDEDGIYDVSVVADRYTLLASHPDYVLAARQSVVTGTDAAEHFVLLPGAAIEGVVRDSATADPVEGATVTTARSFQDVIGRNAPASGMFTAMLPTLSDASGAYRLTGLPPGPVRVTARTPNLVNEEPPRVELAIAETKSGVEIEVAQAHTVSGFVVDRDDEREGMAGVNVVLISRDLRATGTKVVTDDSGFYELAGVGPGEYAVLVVGGGAAPQITNEGVVVDDGDVGDLLSRAAHGVSVSGRVESPERASVRLEVASSEPADPRRHAALALARPEFDGTGGFRFPAVAPGDYIIVAKTLEGEGRSPLTVTTRPVADLSLDIQTLGRLEGQLRGPGGAPVSGALVVAEPNGLPVTSSRRSGQSRTDDDGRFEIVGLPEAHYEVTVFDKVGQRPWAAEPGQEAFEPMVVDVAEGTSARLDLTVQTKGAQVQGTIVGPDGEPVEDAWVHVTAQGSARAPFGHQPPPTLTDSSGAFAVEGVFGETFDLRATGPRGQQEATAAVSAGAPSTQLVLVSLSTVVASVTEEGAAAADFDFRVSEGPTRVFSPLVPKSNGTFVLPDLQSGDYEIEVATKTGYAKAVVSVGPAPETTVELELQARGSVHGLVLDADGTPLGGGKVLMFDSRLSVDGRLGPDGIAVADDGTFEVTGLPPGSGRVMVLGPREKLDLIGSASFTLKPGADLDLGSIQRGKRPSLASAPFDDTSEDLGLRFFVGPQPPTAAQLRAIDEADDPREELVTQGARLWVAEVTAESPAAAAGLRADDAVLSVGQMQVSEEERSPGDAMISLSRSWRSKGRSVIWTVERGGRRLELPVLVPE